MNIVSVLAKPAWYSYLIIALLTPIGIFVTYKIFVRYKVIYMGNNQVAIQYPVLRKKNTYALNEINYWKENVVKTGKNSTYKELEIVFADKRKLSVGHKEHTDYARMISYLNQKAPRKKS